MYHVLFLKFRVKNARGGNCTLDAAAENITRAPLGYKKIRPIGSRRFDGGVDQRSHPHHTNKKSNQNSRRSLLRIASRKSSMINGAVRRLCGYSASRDAPGLDGNVPEFAWHRATHAEEPKFELENRTG